MRKSCILIFISVLVLLVSGCSDKPISAQKGEKVFGAFSALDMDGNAVNEQIFNGYKLTMVNIWATFCNSCVEEMPDLAELKVEFGDDLQIIGIVIDASDRNGNVLPDKKVEAATIIEKADADYLHLLPSKSLDRAYLKDVQSVPVTVFVDENGNQIGTSYFGAKSKSEWKRIVSALLESLNEN